MLSQQKWRLKREKKEEAGFEFYLAKKAFFEPNFLKAIKRPALAQKPALKPNQSPRRHLERVEKECIYKRVKEACKAFL